MSRAQLLVQHVRFKVHVCWQNNSRHAWSFILSAILHAGLLFSFHFRTLPKSRVQFFGNVLHISLSPIEHMAKQTESAEQKSGEQGSRVTTDENAQANYQVQNKSGSKVAPTENTRGKKSASDAMACMSVEVGQLAKQLKVQFPIRYFVQVRTNNAAVPGGAWFVDEWMPERPTNSLISKKLFELFRECIANSDFPEQARKAVNYAPEVRTFSFAVNFTE